MFPDSYIYDKYLANLYNFEGLSQSKPNKETETSKREVHHRNLFWGIKSRLAYSGMRQARPIDLAKPKRDDFRF